MLTATFTALALVALQAQDTVVSVQRGDRLEAENHNGNISVRTWTRSAVMLRTRDGRRSVSLEHDGGEVHVEIDWEHGGDQSADYELTVPAWMPLELNSVNGSISVSGTQAAVSAETVSGSITLEGGTGTLDLTTVEGSVTVTGARARMHLESVNADVTVRSSAGDVSAESVNGEISLSQVDSRNVHTETVNGDITFSGPIQNGGSYNFSTHNGNVLVGVQEGAGATISISTFQGELSADFPITFRGSREKEFSFTLGNGGASVNIESFQGNIRLVRPSAIR